LGFDLYTQDGVQYWGEVARYRFTAAEVDIIEEAANKLPSSVCMPFSRSSKCGFIRCWV
jgi:glutathionylspermidine synthase